MVKIYDLVQALGRGDGKGEGRGVHWSMLIEERKLYRWGGVAEARGENAFFCFLFFVLKKSIIADDIQHGMNIPRSLVIPGHPA